MIETRAYDRANAGRAMNSSAVETGATELRVENEPRALCLWRPWGLLAMTDLLVVPKNPENRATLHTKWRGTLYIHSGKKWDPKGAAAARRAGLSVREADVPTGYIGIVTLVDVHHACDRSCRCYRIWAAPGMWHWVWKDPRPFNRPFPGPGRQSLFRPDPMVLQLTDELLAR